MITMVPTEIIEGNIGKLSDDTYSKLMSQLINFLQKR
jgi:hypothetical protein